MVDKIKKIPGEIKSEILDQLKGGPKTNAEISEAINSNWLTTEKFLKELKEEKKIIELISAPKSKIYADLNDLAFFYLPLDKKIREQTFSLLYTINKLWKEENNQSSPLRTLLQKLAVRFIEENNLQDKIPILRHHYGQTLAVRFEEDIPSEEYSLTESQRTSLKILIEEYKLLSSTDARLKQYEKPSMSFYAQKEKLIQSFSNKKLKVMESNFFNLLLEYPSELSLSFDIFDRGIYCAINILSLNEREEYLPHLKEIFSLIWDSLTTEAYFYDAEKLIPPDKLELFYQIKSNYLNSKLTNVSNVLEELETEINSLEPNAESHNLSEFVHELFND
ncbi:hypothetical protein A3K73_05945 [Candidatus Pacearchaeota archaeon RBG_13_36_9]|nr:MAG: hypothetical protein A3K73_05945 [Candidatus Pacearchaeota archaeon RBG_13_36_9]HJX50564.1 hypothetical protein [Candidatus Nanoarchaeia archaeon]